MAVGEIDSRAHDNGGSNCPHSLYCRLFALQALSGWGAVPPTPIPFTGLLGRNDSKSLIEVQKTIATTVVPYYSGIEELGTELWVHCCWVVTLGFLTGLLTD